MENAVNKKEYLKKYLAGGDKKKKRKKIASSNILKSKIIDDDIDLKNMRPVDPNELEIYDLAEDAPQIAGIIDDRPEEVQVMSEYRETKKWKIITREFEDVTVSAVRGSSVKSSPSRRPNQTEPDQDSDSDITVTRKRHVDSDATPPRKPSRDRKKSVDSHGKAVRRASVGSDVSPPRRDKKKSPSSKMKNDSDTSPPRKKKGDPRGSDEEHHRLQSLKRVVDSDGEIPRRKPTSRRDRNQEDSVEEPPRKKHGSHKSNHQEDEDEQPSRRKHGSHKDRSKEDSDEEPPRRKHDSSKEDSDEEPPRKGHSSQRDRHGKDRSRRNLNQSSDDSSKVKRGKRTREDSDEEPPRKRSETGRTSEHEKQKMSKTLDGKKAGLQDANSMREEAAAIRRRQTESLAQLGDDVSGRGAKAVLRDKKTGKKRDLKEEARTRKEKEAKEAEIAEKYAVWGKGLKQVDDKAAKVEDDLHEMSKPVARYADDADLEEMRRNEEKEGDPMLEYIRKKQRKEGVQGPERKTKPQYQGAFNPNRYNIKPGYRWDGVDRSCGYEKKWFEERNAKKARDDEAFKWSTEDM